ncbi:MAG: hypothetical protein FVQ82_03000 [Planctomycetes bacterium]|nr:hypothetical protein [Planctomycetota bacterium]
MKITPEQFELLLPLASTWAEQQEEIIIREGEPLNDYQLQDARKLNIEYPERIRLLSVSNIPKPNDPILMAATDMTQLITSYTEGLTLRYGIFIRSDCWGKRELVIHELVHTSQYEKFGGFMPFLKQYLSECLSIGYPEAPLEQEAITKTEGLLNSFRG